MGSIRIDHVHKWYGKFHALNDFSLAVGDGEFVALLGPSGCGKTTLLRSIAGLETIDGGEIHLGDAVVSQKGFTLPPEKRRLGLVFQSYALWPHMSVFKNIAYSLRILGWKRQAIEERVTEVLEVVGLPGMQNRYPSELSGGQMQRVAVARSIAPKPIVLLFDEPLSNLDAKLRERMRFDLRELQQQVGITAVYVTHDQGEAMAISDRIVLMNRGNIVQIGTGRELYEEPVNRFAAEFVGIGNFVPALVDGAVGSDGLVDLRVDDLRLRGVARAGTGPEVVLSIRPESIQVRQAEAPADRHARDLIGVVEEVVYMGGFGDIFVRVGETRLRAQSVASNLTKTSVGSTVVVEIDPQDVRVLPAEEPASAVDQAAERPETPAVTVPA